MGKHQKEHLALPGQGRQEQGRRRFLKSLGVVGAAVPLASCVRVSVEDSEAEPVHSRGYTNLIGVSTYSFWHFDRTREDATIENCIERAARMGFDGVEILKVQMSSLTPLLKKLSWCRQRLIMGEATGIPWILITTGMLRFSARTTTAASFRPSSKGRKILRRPFRKAWIC